MTDDTVGPYNAASGAFSAAYAVGDFGEIHRAALPLVPGVPGLVLDIGAGSGRDAAWFAARGWDVVAVEPASAMRALAMQAHPSASIRWIDDRLPDLAAVYRLGLAFNLIWLSGVWMHLPPSDRPLAMRRLACLLQPGGRLVLTLRLGPAPADRPMWPVDAPEVERLGLACGLTLRMVSAPADDLQGRPGLRWQTIVLDLPDAGAGALPLLRGVILRQDKSATYKLALLRCLVRIADTSSNLSRDCGQHIELPLGLIGLYWLRLFKPLVERGLPQRPDGKLRFVTDAFAALAPVSGFDLRPGMAFTAAAGEALPRALADACRLIADMPARHLTFADNVPMFPTDYGRIPRKSEALMIDHDWLWQFGTTRVPFAIWQALRHMSAWIEPLLIAEWVRLTQGYAASRGRHVAGDDVLDALRWIEPERETGFVRGLIRRRLARGAAITCVWSGAALAGRSIDIDHCLPWSAWPCSDLWNLLPSSPSVNRHGKRERIVSAAALAQARPLITQWWQDAYLEDDAALCRRFITEVQATLPIGRSALPDLDDVFMALDFRRLRLRQDAQVSEWAGLR